MVKACFLSLLFLSSIPVVERDPLVTKVVFRLIPANSSPAPAEIAPKTIYVAGDRYARIEEPVDAKTRNLIIVNQPDIWVIDGEQRRGNHMVNPGPDFTVHNPILGPNGPQEMFGFEYGREMRFFAEAATKNRIGIKSVAFRDLGSKNIEGTICDVHEIRSGDYRVLLNIIHASQIPHSIKIFLASQPLIQLEYIDYKSDIPFDQSLFKPPDGIAIAESPGRTE